MAWDAAWENIFLSSEWGKYPPEELVRFISRSFRDIGNKKSIKTLEIGCGTGANVWFLSREGFSVTGIDGSATAIQRAQQRLQMENLLANLLVGDISHLPGILGPSEKFDAIIDICCLQHNNLADIQKILSHVYDYLKPDGSFFSMVVAKDSWGHGCGDCLEPRTFSAITEGPLRGCGLVHFFDLEELRQLLSKFSDVQIEYSLRSLGNLSYEYKHWIVQGKKSK